MGLPGPGPNAVLPRVGTMAAIRVFIENVAGSRLKHHHDEETLTLLAVEPVSGPYPFPYGFVPGTRAPDGDAVDCFVITERPLPTGELVDCEPIALMEQRDKMPIRTIPRRGWTTVQRRTVVRLLGYSVRL